MKASHKIGLGCLTGIILSACISSYYLKPTNIEILLPATAFFPDGYNKIAVRYNNINGKGSFQPDGYIIDSKTFWDTANINNVASILYYNGFIQRMKNTPLFEAVIEVNPGNFSNALLSDSLVRQKYPLPINDKSSEMPAAIEQFIFLTSNLHFNTGNKTTVEYIDPDFCLYSAANLADIADSTGADMLLSLDYFSVPDTGGDTLPNRKWQNVYIVASWNFYDLIKSQLSFFCTHVDTVLSQYTIEMKETSEQKEAILLASEIYGSRFADYLAPNWVIEERMYYRPWNSSLKPTKKLIAEGNWIKAAAYWRPYTRNRNPKTAARSMYNMALAAEVENQLDAAIDWAVQSYLLYGKEDEKHKQLCDDYIRILAQRKLDIKQLDAQFTRNITDLQ